jgi:hypothetical protein
MDERKVEHPSVEERRARGQELRKIVASDTQCLEWAEAGGSNYPSIS